MADKVKLTTGAIRRIMEGEQVEGAVLQILGAKKIAGNDTNRVRVLASDGKYFNTYAMLGTQLHPMYDDGQLSEFTVVRVDKYITSMVSKKDTGKLVIILLELTVLNPGSAVGEKIGNPVSYTEEAAASTSAAPPAATTNKPAAQPRNTPTNTDKGSRNNYNNNNNITLNNSVQHGYTNPIQSLSPYQNKWVIKARVTFKSPIRTWSNAKGEGKLFSMDLMDETGEIRATAFREQCDKFYDMIQVDNVYLITKCQLKPANKQFCQLKNDYEMTFTGETEIELCKEDESGIPEIKFDLMPISQIAELDTKAVVDTIGIARDIGELQTFTSRTTNKEFKKRDVTLIDTSNAAITVTLWGDEAVNFDGYVQPVLLVKSGRINEFNGGKSISVGNGTVLKINPDIPEGHKLRGWFDNGGGENISNLISARTGAGGAGGFNTEWVSFLEANQRNLGLGDKPDYFQCKALVHVVRSQNAFYKACPQPECNKKVIDEGNGQYRCERCNAVFPNFKYRLLLNISIADWTSNRWVTCFSDMAEKLLNRTSQEIGEALEHEPEEADTIFAPILFQSFIFKLRVKMETFGDMQRNKYTVQSATPVDYKEYNKHLISELQQLTGIKKT